MNDLLVDNPVLRREIKGRLRMPLRSRLPVLVVLPIAVYFYTRTLVAISHGSMADARDMFKLISFLYLTLVVLLAPALSATAISQEREQQTWDAVSVSLLTPAQIICGKWIGRQMPVLIGTVIVLPFLLANAVRGEVGLAAGFLVVAYILLTAQTLVVFGLACSLAFRRTQTSIAVALLITAAVSVGTFIAWGIAAALIQGSASQAAILAGMELNPLYVLYNLLSGMLVYLTPGYDASYGLGVVVANVILQAGALAALTLWLRAAMRRPAQL